ncbi:DUF4269 domain-containing protein [Paenibacillus oenotherae]|uniref:DUF4269 domain-containing protein n=1 Tax=Paenibacillus oenotherae TaxID=1435645 RepID=A0ABS7DAJ2_9BACL|nr:DUF4269 domain-containing protein [Paenibacillus oenotherae]
MAEIRYHTIDYLAAGNERQRSAYEALRSLGVFPSLQAFNPILVGTVPIGIDIAGSDLDIACEVMDMAAFVRIANELYGEHEGFRCIRRMKDGMERTVVNFAYNGWPIEIFGQPVPTKRQNGYMHMIVEAKILGLLGSTAKEEIRLLKFSGLKTEPAFGQFLGLQGDAYKILLDMYHWSDKRLMHMTKKSKTDPS